MIIFNFGIPNSGTDWSQAVFKKIWESQNYAFQVQEPQSIEELNQIIGTMNIHERMILKFDLLTEEAIQAAQQDAVRPFYHYRDPRDVVSASMQLQQASFSDAVESTVSAYQEIHHALPLPGIMVIPYEHIADNAEALIFQMATQLGILLKLDAVSAIAEEVLELTTQPAAPASSEPATGQSVRIDQEHTADASVVQPLCIGKWRDELSQSEQAMVNRFFKPLVTQFGYSE
ncbi:hypothetical protein Pan153_03010 [Gimesia panareensis]|uniref:Sulfotransferase domain protein n=1 Tax=Gimesia panareensis TaxID=2527978 RepID=A0A518FH68_9PLAN|nr:hypothetical protein [Gimesia panareensis]QDV15685.1 hypothetical protein Pan153_03010 [Gimesia panareensis]